MNFRHPNVIAAQIIAVHTGKTETKESETPSRPSTEFVALLKAKSAFLNVVICEKILKQMHKT
jgi:hypothetical protein